VDFELVTSRLPDDVVASAAGLFRRAVAAGAAIGWVDPPSEAEVAALLAAIAADVPARDAALVLARSGPDVLGIGYWRRYERPTHRVNADLSKIAVDASKRGQGVGRALMTALIAAARAADIEVLTLDLRADNAPAIALYETLGFHQYGRIERFVAVGERRYDKLFYALDLRLTARTT
jgi:ribosomal protein S18 acetylase RimI-like enzyme